MTPCFAKMLFLSESYVVFFCGTELMWDSRPDACLYCEDVQRCRLGCCIFVLGSVIKSISHYRWSPPSLSLIACLSPVVPILNIHKARQYLTSNTCPGVHYTEGMQTCWKPWCAAPLVKSVLFICQLIFSLKQVNSFYYHSECLIRDTLVSETLIC